MEKGVLETVLKKFSRSSTVEKVLDVTCESALGKGENYMSDIFRVRAKVLLSNGRIVKRSFILKNELKNSPMKEVAKEQESFKVEAMFYNVIIKEMGYLMEEFEDTNDVMWCQLYDSGSTFLLLEDLRASGFVLPDRKSGLNLDEGIFVLNSIARFHGMGKILETKGIITKDMVKPYILTNDRKWIKNTIHTGMGTFSKVMKESWGPKWEKVADKINLPFETLVKKLNELNQLDETKFNVLNHGDLWTSNIMFKYDWNNRPVALRFIDFPLCHYNSCCWDLTLFFIFGMVPSVRRANMDTLIKAYHESLMKTLDLYRYTDPRPTIEELTEDLERVFFWGYCHICSEYPPIVTDLIEGFEMEQCFENSGDSGGFCIDVYKDKRLIEKIGPDLLIFVEKYL